MGGKISAEMLKAQKFLRQGLTAAEASRKSGISKGAISKSKDCQAIIAEVKARKT
jgi:uncharacterized protein YerC